MIKPDLIVLWPKDVYYPYFVARINKDRELFEKIIIVITEGNLPMNFTQNIKGSFKKCMVLEPDILNMTAGGKDWRSEAINFALSKSVSNYILFFEQDFLVRNGFFEELFSLVAPDVVGFEDGNRFHPACLLIRKDILNMTRKDFGAYPPEGDHFSALTSDLKKFCQWDKLENIKGWHHISGLTHNYRIDNPLHQAEEFFTYNYCCEDLEYPDEWNNFLVNKDYPIRILPNIAEYFEDLK